MRDARPRRGPVARSLPAVLLALCLLAGCRTARTPQRNVPRERLTSVINELKLEEDRDIYRLPYPSDIEGRNFYEATLDRLDRWAQLHPNQVEFLGIVSFAKGICHEKLAHLDEARGAYQAVLSAGADKGNSSKNGATRPLADPELCRVANERADALNDLIGLFGPPLASVESSAFSPREAATARAEEAIRKYNGTRWESLSLLLAENQAVETCLAIRASGRQSEYRAALETLVKRFSDSKRVYSHWMRLGRYHEDVVSEWVARAEYAREPQAWKLADQALETATEIYLKVSQADGYPEKREAQARLLLLEERAREIDRHLQ